MLILLLLIVLAVAMALGFTFFITAKVEKALPPQGEFIETSLARIHYLDKGEGQPLVLIHGLGGSTGSFTYALADILAKKFRLIIIDRPGSAWSTTKAGYDFRLPTQAKIVAEIIAKLSLKDPLIVGHSFGGAVALMLALNHAGNVKALALLSPLTHQQETVPTAFTSLQIGSSFMRRLYAYFLAVPMAIKHGVYRVSELYKPEAAPKDFALRAGGLLGVRPISFYTSSSDMMALENEMQAMEARYPSLNLPVHILYADQDNILDARIHGAPLASKNKNCHLEMIEGGHMFPLSQPEKTAAWIEKVAGEIA